MMATRLPNEDGLCSICASIKLEAPLMKASWGHPQVCLGSLARVLRTTDCALCATAAAVWSDMTTETSSALIPRQDSIEVAIMLSEGASGNIYGEVELTIRFGVIDESGWFSQIKNLKPGRYLPSLRIDQDDMAKSELFRSLLDGRHLVRSARQLDNGCDLDLMKSHLERCLETHGKHCEKLRHAPWELPESDEGVLRHTPAEFRVVNVESLRVMLAPQDCRYVTLSYVWDHKIQVQPSTLTKSSFQELHQEGGLRPSRLPRSVADAIEVCRKMGFRYLWVDSLCIIQDDKNDKANQLYQMDKIYGLAMLTLVEANGSQPSDGICCLRSRTPAQIACRIDGIRFILAEPDLKVVLARSKWYTRGWTFQEFFLSRRMLIFTSSQAYYVCVVESCSEDTEHHQPKDPDGVGGFYYNRHGLHTWELPSMDSPFSCWRIYNNVLVDYTRRELTFTSDTLNAILGSLKALGRYADDTFFCGLPAKQFPHCLLWQPAGVSKRNHDWPSWSWAGWKGAIVTPANYGVQHQWGSGSGRTIITALKDLRLRRDGDTELLIDQLPSDDDLRHWLTAGSDYHRSRPEQHPHLSPDKALVEHGKLHFRSRSVFLSIAPDISEGTRLSEAAQILQYRLMHGPKWIGTMFLTPECAKSYPTTTHNCEFLHVTSFTVLFRNLGQFLTGLPLSVEDKGRPSIFDEGYYSSALKRCEVEDFHRRRNRRGRDAGMWPRFPEFDDVTRNEPRPPKIRMKHVMWIGREGDTVYRLAIGIIADCELDWHESDFCLG